MSWVRQAIDGVKAQPYEELYPTAYGSSAEKPAIFWALSPNDVPPPVKEAVETAVRQQVLESSLTCAIIRLETLGGYYSQPKSAETDEPVGHFAIYLGTSPADTELKTHLPTDLGNPPKSQPLDGEQQEEGARTPTKGDIEDDYGRVEGQSKSSGKRRLSKITANLENWMRSK